MKITQQPVAIVTGASSGIGLGITQALLERGWRVVATSRTINESKDLKPSPDLVPVGGEVSKKETAVRVVDSALKHFGRIDLLVNNAGIFIPKPFTEYTEDDYNRVMNTNVASFFFMTQQVIPQMKKQKSGHVYVVKEGYDELGLHDAKVDNLLADTAKVQALKRCRHGTFH